MVMKKNFGDSGFVGRKSFRYVLTWFVGTAVILGIFGCTPEKTSGPIKLTMWHSLVSEGDTNSMALKEILREIEADIPDIDLEVTGYTNEFWTKLKIAFTADNAPDIFYMQAPSEMAPLATERMLPLNDLMEKYGTADKLLSGTLNNFTYDSKVFGLPTVVAAGVLYCNDELFEQAGVDIPRTFSQLLEVIPKFNEKGITPMLFAGKDLWPTMFYYDILAVQAGGVQLSKDALNGQASFNHPAFIQAAKKLQDLASVHVFKETDLALGWDEGIQKFAQGQVAMVYNGTWVSGIVTQEDTPVKGKISMHNFPMLEGGAGKGTDFLGGAFECFSINAKTMYPDAAYRIVAYICEKMSNTALAYGNGLPSWKDETLDRGKLDPFVVNQYDLISSATDFCLWWDTVLGGEKADRHKSLVLQLLTFKVTPEKYVEEMEKLMNTGS